MQWPKFIQTKQFYWAYTYPPAQPIIDDILHHPLANKIIENRAITHQHKLEKAIIIHQWEVELCMLNIL